MKIDRKFNEKYYLNGIKDTLHNLKYVFLNFRTTTAPSPVNLVTTWAIYLLHVYKDQWNKKNSLNKLRNFIN